MGDAIGQVLSFAVVIAISPIPIIGVILMLATPKARANGPLFLVGWLIGLTAVGTIVLLAANAGDASDQGEPAAWVNILRLVLGGALLAVAVKQWRARPAEGERAELPGWMHTVDSFGAGKAAGFGVLLSALNPKNLLLVVGAGAAIAQTGASSGSQAVALAVFVGIATLGTAIPVALFFLMGERSKHLLDELNERLSQNNAVIMAVICLVIAAKLIGDGISGLSA